ncbi:MAG: hypothetical protein KJ875_08490 [Alphaproteobacteria bacterium]|nr:hypothetical protein [Alphaproteobacteria bacterium]MBU1278866.1 hypothetical protein [Alphaproteobacteria bacterium]MBU1575156.1 hypothetical protein [Alphaproteobacteria bacterium]MBU2077431.1 hypothetical protein [Alphaproteobacteria bacterium]MBU2160936.1 hypothetical protein [Alphaproteobacteria bacterium]
MHKVLLTSIAFLAAGVPVTAFAEMTTEEIVDMFPGAQKIEIKRRANTTKVEVLVDGEKIEVTFDNATNQIRKRETERLSDNDLADELDDIEQHNGDTYADEDHDEADDENDDEADDDSDDDRGSSHDSDDSDDSDSDSDDDDSDDDSDNDSDDDGGDDSDDDEGDDR